MKKISLYKTLQFILFLILTAISAYLLLTDSNSFHQAESAAGIFTLSLLLCVILGFSFLFLLLDFYFLNTLKRSGKADGVSSAPTSIGSRSDCDALIEKYLDKPMPENIGCIMLELTNLKDINQAHGHIQGNKLLHDFSVFLQAASLDLCFVGRNGGNKFLAIFEDCDYEKIKSFLALLDKKIDKHNKLPDIHPIRFRFGIAFDEGAKVRTITDLIALSDRRISNT